VAPVSGTVRQLSVHTVGGVVTTAQAVLEIIPDNVLEVEPRLPNQDVGFVEVGQTETEPARARARGDPVGCWRVCAGDQGLEASMAIMTRWDKIYRGLSVRQKYRGSRSIERVFREPELFKVQKMERAIGGPFRGITAHGRLAAPTVSDLQPKVPERNRFRSIAGPSGDRGRPLDLTAARPKSHGREQSSSATDREKTQLPIEGCNDTVSPSNSDSHPVGMDGRDYLAPTSTDA
jgi:HlyD family secretion protein